MQQLDVEIAEDDETTRDLVRLAVSAAAEGEQGWAGLEDQLQQAVTRQQAMANAATAKEREEEQARSTALTFAPPPHTAPFSEEQVAALLDWNRHDVVPVWIDPADDNPYEDGRDTRTPPDWMSERHEFRASDLRHEWVAPTVEDKVRPVRVLRPRM